MRQRRVVTVFAILTLGFLVVGLRLVKLQGLESGMWLRESERSTVRFRSKPFQRGWILDRNGDPLARTEDVRDLTFRYRGWRRLTVAGQASHAWVTLGGSRPTVGESIERAEELAMALAELPVQRIVDLPQRQMRRDFGFYLERLLGESIWDAVLAALREPDVSHPETLGTLPGFDVGLERVFTRASHERQALADLARVAGMEPDELIEGMERAASRACLRVAAGMAKDPVEDRNAYRREQQLHAEFDDDPARLATRVSYDTSTLVAIRQADLGGLGIHTEKRRIYPPEVADVAPLIVGRIGSPQPADMERTLEHRLRLADLSSLTSLTAEELDELERLRIQVREVDYMLSEERGMLGVEAALEELLRGKRGWVATSERVDRESVELEEPHDGLNVVLTLDTDLQRACQEVLDSAFDRPPPVLDDEGLPVPGVPENWSGAIVLLEPATGRVLALASGPRPTREDLTERYGWLMSGDEWMRIRHRAVDPGRSGNLPPPGSTFKPVSALAGLTSPHQPISSTTTFLCEGSLVVGDRTMGCLGNHGDIDLKSAIARSCNIYFYRLGRSVGEEVLRDMALRFGFGSGRRSGLLLDNEVLESLGVRVASGFHESQPRLGGGTTTTDAMRLAIGQAPLDDVTPLQVAVMMAAIGTGIYRPPSLVAEIQGYPPIPARAGYSLGLPPFALDQVRQGMAQVVDSEVGTGRGLRATLVEHYPWLMGAIAAKTGTAQMGGGPDQAWFAGFLPRNQPRLAFAVLVEDCGLHGSEAAVPLFERLLEKPAMEQFLRQEVLVRPEALR